MNRRLRIAVAAGTAVPLGLAGPATTYAAIPSGLARPNPALVSIHLDYVEPIHGPSGTAAVLAPLSPAIIAQAVADQHYLAFSSAGGLGGFGAGPSRGRPSLRPGRNLVGQPTGDSQIPQLAHAADGTVNSFAAPPGEGSPTPPADGGQQSVRGLGTPPPVTTPSNTNNVPPPNQGFGGTPTPNPPATTTTPTTTTRPTPTTPTRPTPPPPPPPTTTITPTTTTTTTTVTQAPTPPTQPPTEPPRSPGASCGTTGLTITSDHPTCQIHAANMAPGGSGSEVMTVRNDTSQALTLSLRADGILNPLWHALQLGVWQVGTAAPTPLPSLLFWTGQNNTLATLQPGQSIRYQIELYLPTTATNALQGMSVSIDFVWTAQG